MAAMRRKPEVPALRMGHTRNLFSNLSLDSGAAAQLCILGNVVPSAPQTAVKENLLAYKARLRLRGASKWHIPLLKGIVLIFLRSALCN